VNVIKFETASLGDLLKGKDAAGLVKILEIFASSGSRASRSSVPIASRIPGGFHVGRGLLRTRA